MVVLAAVVHLVRPPDLHVDRRLSPARVRKGELAIAHLRLRNRARRTFTGAVGIQRVGDVEVEVALPRLRRGDEDVRTSVLPSGQRGRHEVAPLVLRRADPFDLVRAEQRHGRADELLVLPRVLPFRALHDTRRRSLEGVADDTTPNGTMTFHQMREYVPGDDVRRIHWPSTARVAHTGTLVVRQDVDDAQPFVVVLADTRPEAYPDLDTRELAIDAAASAVVAVAHGHAPFELRTTTGERLGGPTETPTEPALEALALTGDEVRSTLTGELSLVQRGRGGAAAVVVTGDPDAAELGAVTALRSRFARVLLVSVTDGPRPRAVHRGLTMVQGHDAASLTTAWDLAVRG
ncbi:DUF58 domain-containing protein [Nitriliruptoraceae bacterium ZYF776]|nr:DUF58 domain-containing protein [Profundirhabdus halotolerans]